MDDLTEMLKGTLEGCVLEIIGSEETYGYAITRRLNELSASPTSSRERCTPSCCAWRGTDLSRW